MPTREERALDGYARESNERVEVASNAFEAQVKTTLAHVILADCSLFPNFVPFGKYIRGWKGVFEDYLINK
jgi:hypothetical protein